MLIDHRKGRPTPYVVPETTQEPPELVLADTLYLFPGESAVMGRNYNTPPGRALCEFGAIYQKVAENHLWAMNNAGKLALQHLMTDARYRTQVVHR
jgi:hypothetical protein